MFLHVITLQSNTSIDPELELEVRNWMSKVLGVQVPHGDIGEVLKDGQLLCK